MISILIPSYNYNIYPLVLELYKQCLECGIIFEIIILDDGSKNFTTENQKVNSLKNCRFEKLEKNIGRSAIRNLLAKKAAFDHLLFLDADTIPIHNNFIFNYISQLNEDEKVVYGGIEYQKNRPQEAQLLRWIYGNAREALSVEKRKENPNGSALTSNLLIQKKVFISNKFDETIHKYGYEDLLFLCELKKKGILVKHIDNPTFHLGLETSQQFVDKTKIALENLKLIAETKSLNNSDSKILSTYVLLKRFSLTSYVRFLFQKTEAIITANLLSKKPSLFLFDLFKLGYYCKLNTV